MTDPTDDSSQDSYSLRVSGVVEIPFPEDTLDKSQTSESYSLSISGRIQIPYPFDDSDPEQAARDKRLMRFLKGEIEAENVPPLPNYKAPPTPQKPNLLEKGWEQLFDTYISQVKPSFMELPLERRAQLLTDLEMLANKYSGEK